MQTAQPVDQKPQPSQLEKPEAAMESHPLVAGAGAASEKDAKKSTNQDAHFADPKHGAFGVFDGLGSYPKSKEVAETTAAHIAQALGEIDPQLTLDQTEKRVRTALIDASEELRKQEDARYTEVMEDVRKNTFGELSDEDFDEKYEGPKRQGSISNWIRGHWIRGRFDPARPDDINEYLKDWIHRQVQGSTTASVVKLWQGSQGERKAIVANAGDSRVYHYTPRDGKLRIVTVDDLLLHDAVGDAKAREIQDAEASGKRKKDILGAEKILLKQSNPQQRTVWELQGGSFQKKYPWGANGEVEVPLTDFDGFSLTKTIPMKKLEPNIHTIDVEPHDKLIIVSDGVHDYALSPEMEQILRDPAHKEAGKAAEALVKFAKRGEDKGSRDDTTAVVVEIK